MNDFKTILSVDHSQIQALLKTLEENGTLKVLLPELVALKGVEIIDGKKHKDNYYHTLQVVENTYMVTDKSYLRLASILHDIGKAPTKRFDKQIGWTFHNHEFVGSKMVKKIFKRLQLDEDQLDYVICIVKQHGKMKELTENKQVSDSAIRRFAKEIGDDIEDLVLFCKCDITTRFEDKMARQKSALDNVFKRIVEINQKDEEDKWRSPIDGQMIMDEFDIGPSRMLGDIKKKIEDAIKAGQVEDNYEDAYEYMMAIKNDYL